VADRRNGYYKRHLLTTLGDIELCVPRTRRYSPVAVLRAYARREAEIDRVMLAGFVLGLSTRKVGETLLAMLGQKVSAATVSRVAKTLDAAVAAFHRRPLKLGTSQGIEHLHNIASSLRIRTAIVANEGWVAARSHLGALPAY
jgi:transposase-like protein